MAENRVQLDGIDIDVPGQSFKSGKAQVLQPRLIVMPDGRINLQDLLKMPGTGMTAAANDMSNATTTIAARAQEQGAKPSKGTVNSTIFGHNYGHHYCASAANQHRPHQLRPGQPGQWQRGVF